MKAVLLTLLLAASAPSAVEAEAGSPLAKVLSLLSDLQAKVIKDGEAAQAAYAEFAEFCEDRSRNLGFEIKAGKASVEELTGAIDEQAATSLKLSTKVEDTAGDIADDEGKLKEATAIREKEHATFAAEEKELVEQVDMLRRTTEALEKKGGASMLQLKNVGSLTQALSVMVKASLIGTTDAKKLTAFVQEAHRADDADADEDEQSGAPAAAAYEGQSGGIMDVLQDLQDKAESQLDDLRNKEAKAKNDYEMVKQALEAEIKFATKDMDESKKAIAAATEKKSDAEGELSATKKELVVNIEAKGELHHDCMTKAEAFESETNSRASELKALASAKKTIQEVVEKTSGAALDQVSFLQVSSRSKLSSSAGIRAARLVRDLGHQHHSKALAQLASRMVLAMRAQNGADPFEKVKGLISDMILKLEDQAEADATKKAYCDKELAETAEKNADKTDEIEGLSTKIAQATAKSAKLKEEVAMLQNELSKLSKTQAELDKARSEEKAVYNTERPLYEGAISGVQKALKVLKEYYAKADSAAHDASDGAASGIIALLESTESQFSRALAEIISDAEAAVAEYDQITKENAIDKAAKEQDVKYKVKEAKGLDKTTAELSSDRTSTQDELDAVVEYLGKIKEQCIAKPEAYEERKARREAEIEGLKQAVDILEGETALLQKGTSHRQMLRGQRRAGQDERRALAL